MSRKEAREVGPFTRVAYRGFGEVIITRGDRESVEIEAPDHIRPRLEAVVSGDTLILSYRHDWLSWIEWMWHWSVGPVRVHVTVKDLKSLSHAGAGNMTVYGIEADRLEVAMSGAGNVRIDGLAVDELKADLRSLGNLEVSGRATSQEVTLSGAGNYVGRRLDSQRARVRLIGLGNAHVLVHESLEAEVTGLGNVVFSGTPRVASRVTGLGNVKQENWR